MARETNTTNIKGWGSVKEIANLQNFSIGDRVTSFRWVSIVPVKEIIAPFKAVSSSAASSSALHSTIDGTNDSFVSQPVTVTF
jgi:hypothetical protein